MHNIQDLHLRKDLLPLFDYTCSDRSQDALIALLSEFPAGPAAVLERQAIAKGLLAHTSMLAPFTYSRAEFHGITQYIQTLRNSDTYEHPNAIRIRFLFDRTSLHRERGQLTLLCIFLHRIDQTWIRPLNIHLFPAEFAAAIRDMRDIFDALEVEKYQAAARGKGFGIGTVVHLVKKLNDMINSGHMERFWQHFCLFEAWLSIARGIHRQGFNFPVLTDSCIRIRDFYHPILRQPVKNSIHIENNTVLITGPNMSGKSTLLRSIGICVVLAALGLAVPAAECELPLFDRISISIDLHDDLHSGYSHFMSEVVCLKNVVVAAASGQKVFAIFDELFRGTNPEDALAISTTTVKGLMRFSRSVFLVSTHLHHIRDLLDCSRISAFHIECGLDDNTPRFTYRLQPGWSDIRIGQLIFEKEGLNALLS